jgi:hypothetical protein
MAEVLLLAFDGKSTHAFVRHEKHSYSLFGGPHEGKIIGPHFPSARLHQIALLSHNHLPILAETSVYDLPLHYGLQHNAGALFYSFDRSDLTILKMDHSEPCDDFPYRNYPAILPFAPLTVGRGVEQTWRQFASQFPNMPRKQPCELIVVVPPPMTLGVSIWGKWGDAEGVSMVFECNLNAKQVNAYNVCT